MGFWRKLFSNILEERNEHDIDRIWANGFGLKGKEKQTFYDLMYSSRAAERNKRENNAVNTCSQQSVAQTKQKTSHVAHRIPHRNQITENCVPRCQTYQKYTPESEFKNIEGAEVRDCPNGQFKFVLRKRALKRLAEKKEAAHEESNRKEGEE